jgi:hypothetical protein
MSIGGCQACGSDLEPGKNLIVELYGPPLTTTPLTTTPVMVKYCPRCSPAMLRKMGVSISPPNRGGGTPSSRERGGGTVVPGRPCT